MKSYHQILNSLHLLFILFTQELSAQFASMYCISITYP